MIIIHLSQTAMAGAPHRFCNLTNLHTEHIAYIAIEKDFIGFDFQCPRRVDREEIHYYLENADILHFHGNRNYDRHYLFGVDISRYIKKKKVCIHYHGTPQRERPSKFRRNERLLVSTPEMLPLFPEATFFPNLINETSGLYTKKETYNTPPRFCHHYSLHVRKKNTALFLRIKDQFRGNTFDVIGKSTHSECLKKRAQYDVCFDHVQGYYGLVSIEAMAQGLCVLNGANDFVMGELENFLGSKPPFVRTNHARIALDIDDLLQSNGKVKEIGMQGRAFMQKYWSGASNIHRLIDFYERI